MPELPEVETIRRQLSDKIVSKKIDSIEVSDKKAFIGAKISAVGKTIVRVDRRAKVLRLVFDDNSALFIHFKMTGQMFWQKKGDFAPTRFTRAIFNLNDGSRLLFNDPRKFGWVKVVADVDKEPTNLSIEPFKENFTLANFERIITKSRKPIKLLLMDQEKIGGIGNIYANEALFSARIDPFRPANSLGANEIKKLHASIMAILKKAIACKGSSGKDEWYRQINGQPGCYQEHFLVYQREGQKCPGNCGGKVMRQKQGGRSSFYCPKCQK
jgi:formamidopyrimidine-DNA glycosylase